MPNKAINSDPKKRRSFVALLFWSGYGWRYVSKAKKKMKEELLWSLVGGVTATIFNVIYNYVQEARNRRWAVAAEIAGKIDFYYLHLVWAVAHLELVFEDQQAALSQDEWKSIKTEASPLFVDEQQIRAQVDIVYGVDSYESKQFDEVFGLLKSALSEAIAIPDKSTWNAKKEELKGKQNQLAGLRPAYRKKLVNGAKLWPILRSCVT